MRRTRVISGSGDGGCRGGDGLAVRAAGEPPSSSVRQNWSRVVSVSVLGPPLLVSFQKHKVRVVMKWIPTIKNFCTGKKIRDAAHPWILNLTRVRGTQASTNATLLLHGGGVFAGTEKAPRRINDHLNRNPISSARPDLNVVRNQEIHAG